MASMTRDDTGGGIVGTALALLAALVPPIVGAFAAPVSAGGWRFAYKFG
jgi:hypothetical protein